MEKLATSQELNASVRSIGPVEFEKILGKMQADTLQMVSNADLRYRAVTGVERDSILIRYFDALLSPKAPSGRGYQAIWEQGWAENLREFKASGSL